MAGYKPTHTMASATGDDRLLARSARGYPWNWHGDNEPAIFGNSDDATIVWSGSSFVITGADIAIVGPLAIGDASSLKLTAITKTSATIAVTHSTNTDIVVGTQPAGTFLKDLILLPAGNIVTAGNSGDDVNISVGTAAGGTQLLGEIALMDDNGGAVTWVANTPLFIFEDGHGHAANQFAAGVGPFGGPATTEAITPAAPLYSSASRTIHIRLRPLVTNLTTAGTTVKAIAVFEYV